MVDSTTPPVDVTERRASKRVLTSRACDSCRTRRIRCLQPNNPSEISQPCKACADASLRCTFNTSNKRRGPSAKRRTATVRLVAQKHIHDLSYELDAFCAEAAVKFLVRSFLDHLYPLVPAVHAPSFLADFSNNRQSRDLKFFCLLVSMLSATICTLPGTLDTCKQLDDGFRFQTRKEMLETSDQLLLQLRPADYFDHPTLDQWACSFLQLMANGQQGFMHRAGMYHAEATTLFKHMHLNRISTYHGLDKIRQQLAKKALWLNFTTESHLKLHLMQSDHTQTELAHLGTDTDSLRPLEIDDEFITEDEIQPQPQNRLALVAGLNALTAMNKTWMESATTTPATSLNFHQPNMAPSGLGQRLGTCHCGREVSLAGPLAIAHARLRRLEDCLKDLPHELAAERPSHIMAHPPAMSALLASQYETMRANVHVTHLWAQNHLVELISALSQSTMYGSELQQVKEHCFMLHENIARKLLRFLSTSPKFDLLPNGLVLMVKIRSVGASLLHERSSSDPRSTKEIDDLVQSFATLLADLDKEHSTSTPGVVSIVDDFAC